MISPAKKTMVAKNSTKMPVVINKFAHAVVAVSVVVSDHVEAEADSVVVDAAWAVVASLVAKAGNRMVMVFSLRPTAAAMRPNSKPTDCVTTHQNRLNVINNC